MSAAASLMVGRNIQKRKPVIIYLVPPEVIHVDASEFMSLVQSLTGKSPASSSSSSANSLEAPRHAKLHESRCNDSDSNKSGCRRGRRQFPVRVKARLAVSRPGSETRYSTDPSSCSSEDVQCVDPESKWLIHGGQRHGLEPEYAVGSYNFIDIFQ